MLGMGANELSGKIMYNRRLISTSATFDAGDSDYISVANHADLQVDGEDFSAAFWIKLTADASGTDDLDGIVGIKAGVFRGGGFWFEFKDDASDDQHFSFYTSTASAKTGIDTAVTNIVHNTWYHVVATYDLSTTTGKIYVDGSLEKTSTSMNAPTAYTSPIGIGSWDPYVSCIVNDVSIWNGILLDADQINDLSQRILDPGQMYPEYLKGWWQLDEKSATGADNVIDLSGNSHHGTTSGLADGNFDTADSPTGI